MDRIRRSSTFEHGLCNQLLQRRNTTTMRTLIFALFLPTLFLVGCNTPATVETTRTEPDLQAAMTSHFQDRWTSFVDQQFVLDSLELEAKHQLRSFYELRALAPVWTSNQQPNQHAADVLHLLKRAHYYGLDTSDYRIASIEHLWGAIEESTGVQKLEAASAFDVLLTNESFVFMSHLNQGTLDRDSLWEESKLDQVTLNMVEVLNEGASHDDLQTAVLSAQPSHFEYIALQSALERYLDQYPLTDEDFYIKDAKKDSAKSYRHAKKALIAYGYLTDSLAHVDSIFIQSLQAFQRHNGLEADGVIGKNTRSALMESNASRYRRAVASLQRLRWEADTSNQYIRVNIPSYELKVVHDNQIHKTFNVVVGSPFTPTPEMNSRMTHFITNPFWYVPYSITKGEIMPKAMKDSTYLARHGYRVYDGRKPVGNNVDWSKVKAGQYKIRQNQGRGNALGLVKFMFPNEHNVYIHDTNLKRYFKKDVRAYSHGCMRLQDPLDFADYLVTQQALEITPDTLDSIFANKQRKVVKLQEPMNVHVVYVSCGVNQDGQLVFYKDVYKKDEALVAALFNMPLPESDK